MLTVNSYFEDKVKSIGFVQKNNSISVGVMLPGNYTFGTNAAEKMSVITGALTIKRSTDADWVVFSSGEDFSVEGNSSFDVKVEVETAYLCEYL
ncbi:MULTISPECIES: pyrimidine/purine nucleoside phosphorylase [Aliivibrio]|uniref:Pyrimidine/purine nucleoside phosphorylase n=1 Tax=Aliivibrio finisterrensis TaxID=511998 RepID=A0A4Q5KWN4_9GAMM|nr:MULTISPECIES: pyrimidine/purine nucleoside phosphorylase [Aliivibrio]KAB2824577.1 pyrimidine/purine nucleoside phosphorylase [Aliivibrio finisterrensis]MDD9178462.1 pyrimidine/purine nucleoside phosphorylase [Aliivibrio sp. A6]RYU52960.1 pyrimidine/purine nucleoside phosphorylase [Aliivibrio finisterrensis]RYU53356.1 pyrimidine/purine nucleoside phosphorylase [Aliivibrio finisterrensis]RYU58444.1 pyrimidine/purine nucleoside phosphorylase [Aliivibrio finisterrensis]